MRAGESGIEEKEQSDTGQRTEAVGQPIKRIGPTPIRGEELMEFIESAINHQRQNGKSREAFPRPHRAPAQGERKQDAPQGKCAEMLRLVPQGDAELSDFRPAEGGKVEDRAGPCEEGQPGERSKPEGSRRIHRGLCARGVSR